MVRIRPFMKGDEEAYVRVHNKDILQKHGMVLWKRS